MEGANGKYFPNHDAIAIREGISGSILESAVVHEVFHSLSKTSNDSIEEGLVYAMEDLHTDGNWTAVSGTVDFKRTMRNRSRPVYSYVAHAMYRISLETGGFTLRNGTFFEFCTRAQKQPGTDFFFIIDEINRGNMSRIFGELLMLIEADKRGPEHAIVLTYSESGERFSVPENVYLLGLMNTADRSLAIVDYALRRRFAFHTLKPAYGTRKFREYLLEAEVHPDLVDRIEEKLSALNEQICNDKDLGPGFQIGHSYFMPEESADENWYLGIVETQIKPLLLEYWFDHPERVDRLVGDLLG